MGTDDRKTIIELRDIDKRYGVGDAEMYALRDFSLEIERGEFVMIMGPSGCGKTTLLNIIGLLDRATSGEYRLNGRNVERLSRARESKLRATQIGFIFQNFNLVPNLTLIENVALPLVYSGTGETKRLRMASAALDKFHLARREYYMPMQLSGGQQQRVAIARSLVANPSIILADEPTGNLDSKSAHIVMEELRSINEAGNTIIMVTHNAALTTYATRIIHMLDGEIDQDIQTTDVSSRVRVRIVNKIVGEDTDIDKSKQSKSKANGKRLRGRYRKNTKPNATEAASTAKKGVKK